MKVLQFTIPVQHDKTIVTRIDRLPHFYPYLHRHKEMQITWIQHGDGTLVADNNMHVFNSHEIFVLGANQPHVFKNSAAYFKPSSEKEICSLDVFFDPTVICNTLLNIPELKHLRAFVQQASLGLKVPGNLVDCISQKMSALLQMDAGAQRTIIFIEMLEVLAAATEITPLSTNSQALLNNETDGIRISHIYNYILHNFDKPITLEDVAREAYMTPQAFCRFFKKHTRHTFVSFLNEVRINEARKQFSEDTFESISAVAYNCGFNSITNFNRVFKLLMRQAPTDYIERLKNKIGMSALVI